MRVNGLSATFVAIKSEGFITATRMATSSPAVAMSMTPSLRVKSTRSAGLQAIRTTVAKVSRKFSRAAADATEPEDYEDAPVMDWWQQQQLFGWNDFNNDDGFDYGDDFGDQFDNPGPPDFPAPHLG